MLEDPVVSLDDMNWNLDVNDNQECISPLASLPSTSLFTKWSQPMHPKNDIQPANLMTEPEPVMQLQLQKHQEPAPRSNIFTVCADSSPTQTLNSSNSKQWILTKLRRVVPNRGLLVLPCNLSIDLVVYDFYFEENTLKMLIIVMDTGEFYESSTFYSDLLHLLHSIPTIYSTEKIPCHNNNFKYFYIKTNVGYAHLHNEIWASIRRGTFSKATENWLHSDFLNLAENLTPDTFVRLTTSDIIDMEAKTQFCLLEVPILQCNQFLCPCKSILQKYNYECGIGVRTTPYKANDLLKQMQSPINQRVKFKLAKSVRKIMEHSKTTYTRRLPYNPQCQVDGKCKRQVCAFWTQCCSPNRPIVCKLHAQKMLQQNAMSVCPRHKYTSPIAILMEPSKGVTKALKKRRKRK